MHLQLRLEFYVKVRDMKRQFRGDKQRPGEKKKITGHSPGDGRRATGDGRRIREEWAIPDSTTCYTLRFYCTLELP